MSFELPIGTSSRSKLLRFVDHRETYGEHIIKRYLEQLSSVTQAADLGAGFGRDLNFVKDKFPEASLYAIECRPDYIANLEGQGIRTHPSNIEKDLLPFQDEGLDLIVCNQILEHTKELFWIMHEISRCLKVGGSLIIGVPNIASLHNRIGLLLGKHPTQSKACSAHVRCFSKNDFLLFLQECFQGGYSLKSFDGSQFYPFPSTISQPLARLFPGFSFSIFFLLQKTREYKKSFLEYPVKANLETNFKVS